MRNLPGRPAALEIGIFGQVVALNYFKVERTMEENSVSIICRVRGVLPNGAVKNQPCPPEASSPPRRGLSDFSQYHR